MMRTMWEPSLAATGDTRFILDHLNHDDLVDEPGALTLEYSFDAGLTPPTGVLGRGQLRMDQAAQNAATTLWPSHTTETGTDVSGILGLLDVGSKIYLQDKTDSTRQQMYQMTAARTSGVDYSVLPVRWLSGGTPLLAQRIFMTFTGGNSGAAPVGAWQTFIVDPGWTTSTLRFRTVLGGLQFEGIALGNLGAGAIARIGVLPSAFTPARQQVISCVVLTGITYAFGFVGFQPNGDVITWWSEAGTQFLVSGIVALD